MEKWYSVRGLCKRKILFSVTFLLIIFSFSCGTGKQSTRADISNFEELKELVESRQFEIEQEWAQPISGNQVNLMDNPNFIRFMRDSVQMFLPYFGVRHAGANYGGRDGGIEFEGVPQNLRIKESDKKKNIIIEFEAEEDQEDYNIQIVLFPNGRTSTSVNTSERSSISYRGFINKLPETI